MSVKRSEIMNLRRRYRRVTWFFARVILSIIWWDLVLPKLGFGGWAERTRRERLRKVAVRFRALALDMGGVMIKVGQWFSSRLDVLPDVITRELAGLQDEVTAEKFSDIRVVAERSFGVSLEEKFAYFDPKPLAAASIGQAHQAKLDLDGEITNVVVKVQRPNIRAIVATDLRALQTVARWVMRYRPIRKRVDVPALVDELTRSLEVEMDYLAEGKHANIFEKNFQDRSGIGIPYVVWSHTTKEVITLEDVGYIKITDYDEIEAAGISRKAVSQRLFGSYFRQVFSDYFFHADPHPGNLFVKPVAEAADGFDLIFIDFGMVGNVPPKMRAGLREFLLGIGTKDAGRVVRAYQDLGVLLPGANLEQIEQAGTKVFDRFWGKSTSEIRQISFAETQEFVAEFRELLYELPFQVPENLIFLGRTAEILSGMCVGLDPDFNVWASVEPFLQSLIEEEAEEGVSRADIWYDQLIDIVQALASLPSRVERVTRMVEQGRLQVRDPLLADRVGTLERAVRGMSLSVVFVGFLLGGIQLVLAGGEGGPGRLDGIGWIEVAD